ncbi:MAG: YbaK/EbsC family protein [Nitrososphaerota archaeon]|nr:YbaK/EbsC family protein [Nitrososphaerota archaeon]
MKTKWINPRRMQQPQSDSVQRVKEYVSKHKIEAEIRLLEQESTRTSSMAAESMGCSVAEIAKTIVFVTEGGSPILITLSGDKKVNMQKMAEILGTSGGLRKMSAEEVKALTGYSIGGVPPFPHKEGVSVLSDDSLFRFESVWAAAGSTNAVMRMRPSVLTSLGIPSVSE